MYDFLIIGTGLSSFAALSELNKKNYKVLVIDYGLTYKKSINLIKSEDIYKINPTEEKLFFSDNFATKNIKCSKLRTPVTNSFAFGGLSNIWGCAIEEFPNSELFGWPNISEDIKYGYKQLNKIISSLIPLDLLPKNDFSFYYFDKLKNKRYKNIKIKKSKLAVDPKLCILCNECLYGCRHNATFNSSSYIQDLINSKKIDYKSNLYAESVKEYKDYSILNAINKTGNKFQFKAKKILICMGAINTAELILKSFPQIKKITVKDSQCFNMPLIAKKIIGVNQNKNSLALSQFNIKQSGIIRNKSIHYQVYFPSLYTHAMIDKKFSFLPFKLPNYIKNRIYIIQGYLPSELSGSIVFSLKNGLIESKIQKKYSKLYLNYSINLLNKLLFKVGLFPLKFLLNKKNVFTGYHFGSSLPMSDQPGINNTDLYGRIYNSKNIHILDSTILPSIPSGSFSYLMMANAIRIVRYLNEEKI
jgi:ferredoxin